MAVLHFPGFQHFWSLLKALLDLKAPLESPELTGDPTAPTQEPHDNSTKVATTEYVDSAVAELVNSSPAALDTLKELSDAIGGDANFSTTMTNALALKAPLASPALTGSPTAPTQNAGDNSTKIATTAYADRNDAACVHKTGDETVAGVKDFTGVLEVTGDHYSPGAGIVIKGARQNYAFAIKTDAVTKGTAPSAQVYNGIEFYGTAMTKYQDRLAMIEHGVTTGNVNSLFLRAYNLTSVENTNTCTISCNVDASGNAYTSAPTPAAGDNSTKIATTAFVTTAVANEDATCVHTTGNETIAGTKTFSSTITGSVSGNAGTATKIQTAPSGTSWVNGVKAGGALVSSTSTSYGAVFNAPTKNYRVSLGTYPSNDDLVYLLSITNANVTAGTNTTNKTLTWNAANGTLAAASFSGPLVGNVTGNCSGSSGSCTGNAATATAFSANKAVTLTGAVTGTASSTGGWSVDTKFRGCRIGQSGSTNTNPWYKVATVACTNANDDYSITFFVEESYGGSCKQGILKAHIRTDSNKIINTGNNNTQLVFLSHTGFALSDFVLVCPTAASSTAELWTKIGTAYLYRIFTVLSEGSRTANEFRWTLLNASSAGQAASITTAGTQIASTLAGRVYYAETARDAAAADTAMTTIGNAGSADKLKTPVKIWGQDFDGSNGIFGPMSGVTAIELIGVDYGSVITAANHGGYIDFHYGGSTADYTSRIIESASGTIKINSVSINGSTVTGSLSGNASTATKTTATIAVDTTGELVRATMGSNDCFRIAVGGGSNAGWAEIATGDDYSEPIYVRQYQGSFATLKRTATLLDGSGNTSFPGTVTANAFSGPLTGNVTGNCSGSSGSCTGNAATATKATKDSDGNAINSTYLKLGGGTMTGNIILKKSNITRGSSTTAVTCDFLDIKDSANNRISCYSILYYTNKGSETNIYAYNTTTGSGGNIGYIGIGCNSSGTVYTHAPTPATSSNDTNIATTAFVKAQGYTTATGHTHSYLPLAGGTMTGNITATNAQGFKSKNSGYAKGDAVASWTYYECLDKNNARLCWIGHHSNSDKSVYCGFHLRKQTTNDEATLTIGYDKDGNVVTSCPTPGTGSNTTHIATTNWVRTYCETTKKFLTSHQSLSNYCTLNGAQTISATKTFNVLQKMKELGGTANNGTLFIYGGPTNEGSNIYMNGYTCAEADPNGVSRKGSIVLAPSNQTDEKRLTLTVGSFWSNTNFLPEDNNSYNLGHGSYHWKALYVGSSTVTSSDRRIKSCIEPVPDAALDAWEALEWRQFKFNEAIESKGETGARLHMGLIAQEVGTAFSNAGLDPDRYGLYCHDAWDEVKEARDAKGRILAHARPAGDQFSIRYEEALCLEAAYQRRLAKRMKARILELEERLALVESKLNS